MTAFEDHNPTVHIARVHPELGHTIPWPKRMTEEAAGIDLAAAIDLPRTLACGQRALIPCGFAMALPPGFEGQIRPRSGLAWRHGLSCLNAPGTIDADYRGEIKVLLINWGEEAFEVTPGMRIAQLVIAAVPKVTLEIVESLPTSGRGAQGFGSTGYKAAQVQQ